MKKLTIALKINFVFCILFSLSCIPFAADISLAAFPLSVIWSLALAFLPSKNLLKDTDPSKIDRDRRFFQYEPIVFITAFVIHHSGNTAPALFLDWISAIMWVAVTVCSFIIQYSLNEKRVWTYDAKWASWHKNNPKTKPAGMKRIAYEILEWADALIQAVFTIILLNIFLFQLYEIPSESMVPTFLVKDRVIVFKTLAGPKFPLSEAGIPYVQNYNKGDIVVFRNPHYSSDRKSERKTFFSQFLYMCSLTLLKTNTDDNGELKADPLVKRIAAVGGEQIYMLDGTLYARTKESNEFKPVDTDGRFAAWNLNGLPAKTKQRIQYIPLDEEQAKNTLLVEELRRSFDLKSASIECESISMQFAKYAVKAPTQNGRDSMFSKSELLIFNMFNNANSVTSRLLSADGGSAWFDSFLNDWHRKDSPDRFFEDKYEESCFRLNVMSKLVLGRLILRNAELIANGISTADWKNDGKRRDCFEKASLLADYINYMDLRNLSVFPPNKENGTPDYIPENCYFMMGDNRYNSLDMRHSYERKIIPLYSGDEYSFTYYSSLAPQYVERSRILGKASFRFWPVDRAGVPDKGPRERKAVKSLN